MATFEEEITQLENIVRQLEGGSCTLEESLGLFEKGIKLSKSCNEMLEKAEKKVNVLINGENQEFGELGEQE